MFCLHAAAPSLITASLQYRQPGNVSRAWTSVKCTANVGHATAYSVPGLVKDNMTATGIIRKITLGEKMRFGRFEEDELVYKESFVVGTSQVGVHKTATIETIASLLQETTCNRVQCFGWSTDGYPTPPIMRKHRLTWVTSRVYIEMYKYPAWSAFPEDNNQSVKKIPKLNEPAEYSQLGLKSIPQDVVDTHELEAITIEYRQECQYGDSIDSLASTEVECKLSDSNKISEGRLQFLHLLKFSGTDQEINHGRTVWRKLER
ncbi:hypothetical protein LUZ61_017735 [Rhynchospora tenuis]|uniref:Acyl-[acyl-carrier-protein] hydrolase n=1 Tax=Rhynchospora tenuis TaxID=198213 RepID=A0AAD5Z834_9POAL|nr:hypothetical protein LUZ61_017735 [Rhynchospora tenuis]